MTRRLAPILILVLEALMPQPARPAEAPNDSPNAAFLFEYVVKPGHAQAFEDGYARHLDWHRAANDPFHWYGWYVSTGPNVGRFVDGTFGLSFAAFDARVDPAGDRADGERNLLPHVEPVDRSVWRHRRDLGGGDFLERAERVRMLEVRRYVLRAGADATFEAALGDGGSSAWYELVVGGDAPAYLRITPRAGFAAFASPEAPLETDDAVLRIETETWTMVDRLSYFPERSPEQDAR